MSDWPFAPLLPLKYGMIVADPPWDFQTFSEKGHGKSAHKHYACMSMDEQKALPVGHLAAGDCCLFLWATWPMLPEAMDLMRAWGFSYRTGGAWHKKTPGGKTAFGTGYRARCACEPFLLGFMGNPPNSRAQRNLIEGVTREHSRKPDEAYRWAEAYLPDVWRVELFSRQARPNWDAWGDQTQKFQAEDAA